MPAPTAPRRSIRLRVNPRVGLDKSGAGHRRRRHHRRPRPSARAKKLGLTDVPVMVATGWTKAQIQAYALADNKLALNAGWDEALLSIEIGELQEIGFDIGLIGFSDAEIAGLAIGEMTGLTDPDEVPEVPTEPVSRPGDLWVLGRHRLLCGDSTDAAAVKTVLGNVRPHLMITDPPYGVEYEPSWRKRAGVNLNRAKLGKVANDDRADWSEAWKLFPGSIAYVWHAGKHASTVQELADRHRLRGAVADHLGKGPLRPQPGPLSLAARAVLVRGQRHGEWHGDRKQSTLWQIAARDDHGHGHSTQKPVECMKRPIENNSSPGQAVYEPFSGRDDHHRRRDHRPVLPRDRADAAVRRCRGRTLAGVHRRDCKAGGGRPDIRRGRGRTAPAGRLTWAAARTSQISIAPAGRGHGGLRHPGDRHRTCGRR